MKSFLGLAVAVLLAVSVLFVAAPDAAQARGVHRSKMEAIKAKADKALIVVVQKKEKEPNKRQWKQLHKHAMNNALVAGYYLQVLQQGEEVFEDDANTCDSVARMVFNAVGFISAGQFDRANGVMSRIEVKMGNLPIARAAAVVNLNVEVRGSSINARDIRIIVTNTRRDNGAVIIVVTGGGNNTSGGNDNGGGNDDGGGDDDNDDNDGNCREANRVEISRSCVDKKQIAQIRLTETCENRPNPVTRTIQVISGDCCIIDIGCDDKNPCTDDKCVQGVCKNTDIDSLSPFAPNQCQK